jgi:hypothetical protein
MPTIANPRGLGSYEPPFSHPGPVDSPTNSLALRMKVTAKRGALTERLAKGVDPTSTSELALRASQLTSPRRRRQMAKTLRSAVAEARHPSVTRSLVSILNRRAVLEAVGAIQATIARLADPEPVAVKGMAMLERMITDGGSSPLYSPAEPGTLRRQLLVAKGELDTAPVQVPTSLAA